MREGEEGYSIHLKIPGGDEGAINALAADASKQEIGGTSTNVLSANYTSQMSLILRNRRETVRSVRCGRLLKV